MKRSFNKIIEIIEGEKFAYEIFHQKSKYKFIKNIADYEPIPSSWIKIHFKAYPRLRQILLSRKFKNDNYLTRLLHKRRSIRNFIIKQITKEQLSYILYNAAGLQKFDDNIDNSRRPYPSAGARYPLEIYPIILNCRGMNQGLYHYNVKDNSLELLYDKDIKYWVNKIFGNESWVKNPSLILLISGVIQRTSVKYGERAYRHMLLEAGHLAQNICLLTTSIGLGSCPIGGFVDDYANEFIDVGNQKEFVVHAISIGKF